MLKHLAFLILVSATARGQSPCMPLEGIGFLKIPAGDSVELLHADLSPYMQLAAVPNAPDGVFAAYSFERDSVNITCLSETAEAYHVVTNGRDRTPAVIRKSPNIRLAGWEEYLLGGATLCSGWPITDTIDGKPVEPGNNFLNLIRIQDEWLQLEWEHYSREEQRFLKKTGWVRWKKDGTILITVMYLR